MSQSVKSGHLKRFSINIPNMEQNRLQGWLTVANAIETDHLDQLEWQKRYCILDKDDRKLYFFNDTESVLTAPPLSPVKFNIQDDQDGSAVSSTRKNALSPFDSMYSNFQRNTRQTRSLRDRMRNTISKSVKRSTKGLDTLLPPGATGGGSVRVARSRSFGKVDKIDQSMTLTLPSVTSKLGHSLENLHRVSSHGTPDGHSLSLGDHGTFLNLSMRGTLSILPLHESISPRHSCFRIITDRDILYASCGSQQELDKWLTNLLDCQRPNKNHLRRLDTQLSIWVLEARNLQPKKSYFCEVSLNGVLYAQTCCKVMNDILFWGEPFVFNDLPPLGAIMVKIYRENYNKKRREKVPATDLGKVEVPALVLEGGQVVESWYPVSMYTYGKGGSSQNKEKDSVSLRLKLQYQVVSILPLKAYDDFLKYLESNYSVVCDVLEPVSSARAKDDIAQTLVRILQVQGKAKDFLCDIIMAEVHRTENENLIFRGNTFATKAVDTYMKMVGEEYLRQALTPFILFLLEYEDDCEVDPLKLPPGANLASNQASLIQLVRKAWMDILSSVTKFPSDLRAALYGIRQRFGPQREDACFKLISGSIFLRFICPAILSPSLFRLCQEYPDEKTARKLTLVAKVLQNLANFARFGVKEEYMCFMNDFVEIEIKNMKEFLNKISTPLAESDPVISWTKRHIDLGREASIMHSTLTTQLKSVKLSEDKLQQLDSLVAILLQLSKAQEDDLEDPFSSTFEALRVMQTTISSFTADKDNSDSSSEYTTPAQSQPTSPAHEQSPPPLEDTARVTLGSAAKVLSDQQGSSSPPSTSPTHSGGISRLVTHSHSSQVRNGARPLSDTELQPGKVPSRKSSSGGFSLDVPRTSRGSLKLDDHASLADLRAENSYLRDEVESLRRQLARQHEETEKESERLRRLEEDRRRSEHELKNLRDSRGKILRGLNTQTEIALIQFKRDFEHLRKQLQAKDEIIAVQEKRIASLIESNMTLRSGLQELNSIPRHEDSDSDDLDEDVRARMAELERSERLVNGHSMATSTGPGRESSSLNPELQQLISQLEGGKFDL